MSLKAGAAPACAACKYQRRKCTSSCPLAPYFPATDSRKFQNVHRLFGVSNVTKILKALKTKVEKDDAMTSIIYEADMRRRYPVHGCLVIMNQLRWQLHLLTRELGFVYGQLDMYKKLERNGTELWPWTGMEQVDNMNTYCDMSMNTRYNEVISPFFIDDVDSEHMRMVDPMFDIEFKPNFESFASQPDGESFYREPGEYDVVDDQLSSCDSSEQKYHPEKQCTEVEFKTAAQRSGLLPSNENTFLFL